MPSSVRLAPWLIVVCLAACGGSSSGTDAAAGHDGATIDGTTGADARAKDGVTCLGMQCDPTQACCGGPMPMCQNPAQQCMGPLIMCDGPEDCPTSGFCCEVSDTACTPAASCTGQHVCHDTSECATGEMCCPNGGAALSNLSHCEAVAPGASCPLPP